MLSCRRDVRNLHNALCLSMRCDSETRDTTGLGKTSWRRALDADAKRAHDGRWRKQTQPPMRVLPVLGNAL
jgi:hypothetical protein